MSHSPGGFLPARTVQQKRAESTDCYQSHMVGKKNPGRIINVFAEIFKTLLTNLLMLFMTGRHSGFRKLHWGMKGDQSQHISGTFLKTTHYLTAAEKWRGMFLRHHVHLCGTIVHSGGHVRAQHEPEQWHLLKSFSWPPPQRATPHRAKDSP